MLRSSSTRHRRLRALLIVVAGIPLLFYALEVTDIAARSIGWNTVLVLIFCAGVFAGRRSLSRARRPRARR